MSKHANLPFHLYVHVDNQFLGPDMPEGTTPAVWHGVYGRPYQLLLCHVLLESGAHWSGLPLHALSATTDFSLDHDTLMPWKTMGEDMDLILFKYLEGLEVTTRAGKGRHTGVIVDWKDGYSRYQQEHKPLNLVQLYSGQFCLMPNNYCRFTDSHFTTQSSDLLQHYRRSEEIYWENNIPL